MDGGAGGAVSSLGGDERWGSPLGRQQLSSSAVSWQPAPSLQTAGVLPSHGRRAETQRYAQSPFQLQTMALDNVGLRTLVESCDIFVVVVAVVLLNAHGSSRAANEAVHSQSQGKQSRLLLPTAVLSW